jgi:hypothetical protein
VRSEADVLRGLSSARSEARELHLSTRAAVIVLLDLSSVGRDLVIKSRSVGFNLNR